MPDKKARVGIGKEGSRRTNVAAAMRNAGQTLREKLGPEILVKPNFLSSKNQLIATHPDAVRGVLDFVLECGIQPSEVLIAEGAHAQETGEAYRGYGFTALEQEYDFPIRWLDLLLETDWQETEVRLADDTVDTVRMPKRVLQHPCTISLAIAKTHDAAVVTLALKNMIMGCLHGQDRIKIHGYHSHRERTLPREAETIQANLTRISRFLAPTIAVIDGTVGVQGNGPGGNDSIELGIAMAGTDVFAVDAVMAHVMGFQRDDIGLLVYGEKLGLGVTALSEIETVGAELESVVRPFTPHETHSLQVQWRNPDVAAHLGNH